MSRPRGKDRIFVAVDTPDAAIARDLVRALRYSVGGFKIGLQLFCSHGPSLVREIRDAGLPIFVDLKLHDIPNTVAGAAAAITQLGVDYFTVHAAGGSAMVRKAADASAEAAASEGLASPTVLAVTVLTSIDAPCLHEIGWDGSVEAATARLARLARDAGAGGLVCSPLEVESMREVFVEGTLVVPGIRLAAAEVAGDDQSRVATPARAVALGADFLVIGRPITRSDDPEAAARTIAFDLDRH